MFCGVLSLRRHLRRRTCRPRFISYGARTSGRNSALPIERTTSRPPDLSGREQTFDASVFQLAGGSEDPPVFDITRTIRVDQGAAEFVRVPLNFSALELAPTTAQGGLAALCSPGSGALTGFLTVEAPTAA